MRETKKLRLPKWAISKLPFKEEDDAFGAFVVPFVLFPIMGISFVWNKFHTPGWTLLEILIIVILIAIILTIAWWLFAEVESLKEIRTDLMLEYKLAKDGKEKEEIKEELKKILSDIDYLKFLYEAEKNSKEKEEIKGELKKILSDIDYLKFLYEAEKNSKEKERIRRKLNKLDVFVK